MICECSRLVPSLDHAISLARHLEQSLTSWLQKVFDDSHPFLSKIVTSRVQQFDQTISQRK